VAVARPVQARLSRDDLLDAAEEVFARKGFHTTTLREIAELAEFSVGSVYSFFPSKDALFAAIFARRGEEFMPSMRALLEDRGSPREQLHRLADYQIDFFRTHASFGRLFLRATGTTNLLLDLDPADPVSRRFAAAMALQADLFTRGQRAGELRPGDPAVLSHLFSGIVAAYQACDPVVTEDAAPGTERLALSDLHALLDGAFAVNGAAR
jgi:AcrR family transcriptional regulator